MQYSVRFTHINQDYGVEAASEVRWSTEFEEDEDFVLALNRMAIASSSEGVVDFPEMEVRANGERVTIHSISGQLYFTDSNSQNRQNLKVVPIEIVRLLQGQSLEEVFVPDEEEAVYLPSAATAPARDSKRLVSLFILLSALVAFSFSMRLLWRDVSYAPRLVQPPKFVPSLSEEGDVLSQYADVYVSEYREGAQVFELTREGQFTLYEIWFSQDRNNYVLIPILDTSVQVGLNEGSTALLADEIYLLAPQTEETIDLHGVTYTRHHGKIASLGEVLAPQSRP